MPLRLASFHAATWDYTLYSEGFLALQGDYTRYISVDQLIDLPPGQQCCSRCRQPFAPFPGFRPMASYPEYSADFFDGEHYVIKGASPVTAREMWDAVKDRAKGRVSFAPDPAIQAIMDAVPKATSSARAAELGLPHSRDIGEIVREYEEAALAHHG